MNSALKLGYGPISEQELDRLVRAGQVEEYVENGKLKFRRKTQTPNSANKFGLK